MKNTKPESPSIVSDATPLISLACVGRLQLLHELYGTIVIPPAIWEEVVVCGRGRAGEAEVRAADWVRVVPLAHPERVAAMMNEIGLDRGESEAFCLAHELNSPFVLVDERRARRYASASGIAVVGTLGVLVAAQRRGLLSDLRETIHAMRVNGIYFSDRDIERAVRMSEA